MVRLTSQDQEICAHHMEAIGPGEQLSEACETLGRVGVKETWYIMAIRGALKEIKYT